MSRRMSKALALLMGGFICAVLMGSTGQAQLLDRKAISLAEAKKMVTAAMAEAVKNKWQMVGVQLGSVGIAERKAKTSALLRRPTKALEDAVMGNPGNTPPAPPRNTL